MRKKTTKPAKILCEFLDCQKTVYLTICNDRVENETGGADDAPVEVPVDQVETALDTNRDENNNVMIGSRSGPFH